MTLVGRPADHLPGRADDGTGPAQPSHDVDIVRELVADGVTIFLTTQYLDEADQLADRIAVLDQGRLVAEGTPDELKRQMPGSARPAPVPRRRANSTRPRGCSTDSTPDDEAPDPAGAQRRRHEIAAGPAGPARRVLDQCRGVLRAHAGPRRCFPCPDGPRRMEVSREMSTTSAPLLMRRSCCVATSSTSLRNPIAVFNAVLLPIVHHVDLRVHARRRFQRRRRLHRLRDAGYAHAGHLLRAGGHRDVRELRHDERHHQPVQGHGRLP